MKGRAAVKTSQKKKTKQKQEKKKKHKSDRRRVEVQPGEQLHLQPAGPSAGERSSNMPYCCAVTSCGNKIKKGAPVSFHHFPLREPTRLRLWLLALDIDVNTDLDELRKCYVCSDHFVLGDYASNGLPENGAVRRYLRPTAVPRIGVSRETSSKSVQAVSVVFTLSLLSPSIHPSIHLRYPSRVAFIG